MSGSFVHLVEVTIRVGTHLGVMSATLSEPLNTQLFSPINKPKFSRNISELCVQNLNIFIESLKIFYCYAKYLISGNAGPTLYSSILYLTILGDKIHIWYILVLYNNAIKVSRIINHEFFMPSSSNFFPVPVRKFIKRPTFCLMQKSQ